MQKYQFKFELFRNGYWCFDIIQAKFTYSLQKFTSY